MSMAPTLQNWLRDRHLSYDMIEHSPTSSSLRTALACGIPSDRMAKAVVLKDGGDYVLAVLPASNRVELSDLSREFGHRPQLASEAEIGRLFDDCASGAVPPAGECYGIEVIVDDSIAAQPDVYFEGGDHATLVHMGRPEFTQMMAGAQHASFSSPFDPSPHWRQ